MISKWLHKEIFWNIALCILLFQGLKTARQGLLNATRINKSCNEVIVAQINKAEWRKICKLVMETLNVEIKLYHVRVKEFFVKSSFLHLHISRNLQVMFWNRNLQSRKIIWPGVFIFYYRILTAICSSSTQYYRLRHCRIIQYFLYCFTTLLNSCSIRPTCRVPPVFGYYTRYKHSLLLE